MSNQGQTELDQQTTGQPQPQINYRTLQKAQLRQLCDERGIRYLQNDRKETIIEKLLEKDAAESGNDYQSDVSIDSNYQDVDGETENGNAGGNATDNNGPSDMILNFMTKQMETMAKMQHQMQIQNQQILNLMAQRQPQMHKPPKPTIQKLTEKDDIESYLFAFERIATQQQWKPEEWSIQLSGLLTGKALTAYARLPPERVALYEELKKELLLEYKIDEEAYRTKFRNEVKTQSESFIAYIRRLKEYARRWLGISSKALEQEELCKVVDQIVIEQFTDQLPLDVKTRLRELKPKTPTRAAEIADDFIRAHTGNKKPQYQHHHVRRTMHQQPPFHKPSTNRPPPSHQENRPNPSNNQNQVDMQKSAPKTQENPQSSSFKHRYSSKCGLCGGNFPHEGGRTNCPAYGKTCSNCQKPNHFSSVCRYSAGNTQYVSTDPHFQGRETGDRDFVNHCTFHVDTNFKKIPTTTLTIDGKEIEVMLDTGTTVDILDEKTFQKFGQPLQKTRTKLFPYGSTKSLPVLGSFPALIEAPDRYCRTEFYIVRGGSGPLISSKTATKLNLIHFNESVRTEFVNQVEEESIEQKAKRDFPEIFEGLGKLKNVQVKLHIDQSVKPVSQKHRRVPLHLREKVEQELIRLQEMDVIEKIPDEPTTWVSNIVVVSKPKEPNAVRICSDMRAVNKAIQRERHLLPTIPDICDKLQGCQIFSVIDLRSAYNQLELDPASRQITTFSTHLGLFRYKRLFFGVNSGPEIFQEHIRRIFADIEKGVINVSDDLIIGGKDKAEHDEKVYEVLKRLKENNLTVNGKKCRFQQPEVEFYGLVFSKNGLSIHPSKVEAIKAAPHPETTSELRSFLGLAGYCQSFVPNFATEVEPLRRLLRKQVKWEWTSEQETAFQNIRDQIAKATSMAYYNPDLKTKVITDASPVGLAAILVQTETDGSEKVIQAASRSLSDVERRYSTTEKESLSIVWGLEKFEHYLIGLENFTLESDHKALEYIFNNPRSKPPARIERWTLRLQPFRFTLQHRPGIGNPCDHMSRHPLKTLSSKPPYEEVIAEEHINLIVRHSMPVALKVDEVVAETEKDLILTALKGRLKEDQWIREADDNLKPFFNIREELCITEQGLILRDRRIIIPKSLENRVLELAHQGHQGIVKTKSLLRTKVWFPGIDRKVESLIKNCIDCQTTRQDHHREPLKMSPLPAGPWQEVAVDFAGPVKGSYLLILYDEYSRFPVLHYVTTTSARAVIPQLETVFALFGIPKVLKSDNGPPFNGEEFSKFARQQGFHHRKITPRHPMANGMCERFVKTLKRVIQTTESSHENFREAITNFLRNYRSTPHSTTEKTPYELMFSRPMANRILPDASDLFQLKDQSVVKAEVLSKDKKKEIMKDKADRHSKPAFVFRQGDRVLVRKDSHASTQAPYYPQMLIVTDVKGSMVTAENSDMVKTRNASWFIPFPETN